MRSEVWDGLDHLRKVLLYTDARYKIKEKDHKWWKESRGQISGVFTRGDERGEDIGGKKKND